MTTALRKPSYLAEDVLSEHERLRVATLEQLVASLRNFPVEADRAAFSTLFGDALRLLELEDVDIARTLRVSRPTISRWARGDSAPHPLGREPVFHVLAELARARLRRHEADRYRSAARTVTTV